MNKVSLTLTETQMESLANPLRAKVVFALRAYGSGSAYEISERLSIDPKSLYYPLRKLVECGLVTSGGAKRRSRRIEAVFKLAADRFELSSERPLPLRIKLIRSTIRAAEQEFVAAQSVSNERGDVADAMRIFRRHLWLEPKDRNEMFDRMNQLIEEFSNRGEIGKGQLVHWTALAAPQV